MTPVRWLGICLLASAMLLPIVAARPHSPICSPVRCQVYFASMPETIEYIKTGKVRALAVTSATRSEANSPLVGGQGS